jgi:hypothetical protein
MSKVFMALSILAGVQVTFGFSAHAQDRCKAYADEMVAIDQRARQMKCPAWKSHSNWEGHFQWCQKQPPAKVNNALGNWNSQLDGCATTYGGQGGGYQPPKPAAKVDASRKPVCSSFARNSIKWRNLAVQKGCNVAALPDADRLTKSEQQQFDMCMATSDAEFRGRSAEALGFKGLVEKQCSAQLRRPFKL